MNQLVVKIPFPPNLEQFRSIHDGTTVKEPAYVEYQETIVAAFADRRDDLERADFYALEVIVFPPDRRKKKIGDVFKAVYDALEKAQAWPKKSRVVTMSSIFGPAVVDPFVIVKASPFVYPEICKELIPENWGEATRWYDWERLSVDKPLFKEPK